MTKQKDPEIKAVVPQDEVGAAPAKAYNFEVLAGIHMLGEVPCPKGTIIASDDDLVAIYGNRKFRRVE